jgi:hypothetical protein
MAVWKPVAPSLVVELHAVSSHVGWPSEGISGAILSHGAWQFRLEYVNDRWAVAGRGELTHDHFYELLTLLLRLDERSPGGFTS